MNLCNPGAFMRHRKTPTNKVTHPGLMVLKPDVVWVGCDDPPECKHEIAIKKCEKHEFEIQKSMHKQFPKFVPDVYKGIQCTDGFYMYSEYVDGGSLKKHKNDPRLSQLVHKVFLELKIIHDKRPSFRHNDLHVDNVLIKGNTPLIYDFGFSNMKLDKKLKDDYGIYPRNNPMYDFHFFTNSIVAEFPQKFKDKALSVFPPEYIAENSSVVKNWRLRSDVIHKNLPTMDQVIKAFSSQSTNKMRPKVLTFSSAVEKKTVSRRSPPPGKASRVKFTLSNKRKMSNRKAELMRKGMNEIQAELQAISNIEALKMAGLISPNNAVLVPKPKPKNKVLVPNRPAIVVSFTSTPRKRPVIGKKLCSSYKKDELMNAMKRLGHRVDKKMTVKEMCMKLAPVRRANLMIRAATTYTRPISEPILNVRKSTYSSQLKKPLYTLAKTIGTNAKYKNKKAELVNKIYAKLNKNIKSAIKNMNANTVTARQVAQRLATNYKWKNDRHVERIRLLKIYRNKK